MTPRRRRSRPRLEILEGRDTPSNFTVSFSGLTHTLTVTGDSLNNNLTVQAVVGDATKFALSSATDTFNHVAGPLTTPSGVLNLKIVLGDGDDAVTLSNSPLPIDLTGNLSVMGGNGANSVAATDMKVEKNLTIINGTNTSGSDFTNLVNPSIGRQLTINNGAGDTSTDVHRSSAGLSSIGGNASVINGTGADSTEFYDINFGGNVTINNGHGDTSGNTGFSVIYNVYNTSARSVVKGNVTISKLDGNVSGFEGLYDTEVLGNVTFNQGTGSATTNFDCYLTTVPVIIRGSLTMTGSGANTVTVGTQFLQTGLVVGKNLTITTGAAADVLRFNKLEVGGTTKLTLGGGNNTVTIDNSEFVGPFTLTTGAGTDSVSLDHTAGTAAPTIFERPVLMYLGAGADQLVRAGGTDANQELIVLSTFVVHYGSDPGDTTTSTAGHEIFPFGTSIQWVA